MHLTRDFAIGHQLGASLWGSLIGGIHLHCVLKFDVIAASHMGPCGFAIGPKYDKTIEHMDSIHIFTCGLAGLDVDIRLVTTITMRRCGCGGGDDYGVGT